MKMTDVFIGLVILIIFYLIYIAFLTLFRNLRSKKITSGGPIFGTGCVQEDPEVAATKKRVRKAFEDQQQQLHARSMKAHNPDCPDTWQCTKDPCFIWQPDKIVHKEVVKSRLTRKRIAEREELQESLRKPDKPFKRRRLSDKE